MEYQYLALRPIRLLLAVVLILGLETGLLLIDYCSPRRCRFMSILVCMDSSNGELCTGPVLGESVK
jgi:hypothetical protein